jgi:hypothetical protein
MRVEDLKKNIKNLQNLPKGLQNSGKIYIISESSNFVGIEEVTNISFRLYKIDW